MKFSNAVQNLIGNPMQARTVETKKLEAVGKRIIHFEIGEPDFTTPDNIIEAAITSLRQGETHYESAYGLQEFRRVIAESSERVSGFKPDLDQIVVAPALSLIYFFLQSIIDPGDEVIVPDPGYTPYYSMFNIFGATAVNVQLHEDRNFRLDADDVRSLITDRTKLILINSPQNPTGAVMNKNDIERLSQLATEHDIPILSDEVYNGMMYGGEFSSPGITDCCKERSVIVNSFSKSYAMTGWRLGYMIGPAQLMEKVSLLISNSVFSVPTFIQKAGIEALTGSQAKQEEMVAEYRKRRDILVYGLNNLPGVSCVEPEGAFYVFPNIKGTGMTSEQFADFMLAEAGVALLPGTDFGKYSEGYVRLSYSISPTDIEVGLRKMKAALAKRA